MHLIRNYFTYWVGFVLLRPPVVIIAGLLQDLELLKTLFLDFVHMKVTCDYSIIYKNNIIHGALKELPRTFLFLSYILYRTRYVVIILSLNKHTLHERKKVSKSLNRYITFTCDYLDFMNLRTGATMSLTELGTKLSITYTCKMPKKNNKGGSTNKLAFQPSLGQNSRDSKTKIEKPLAEELIKVFNTSGRKINNQLMLFLMTSRKNKKYSSNFLLLQFSVTIKETNMSTPEKPVPMETGQQVLFAYLAEHPVKVLNENQMEVIKAFLRKKVKNSISDKRGPYAPNMTTFVEKDCLKIKCEDTDSLAWVESILGSFQILKLRLSYTKIKSVPVNKLTKVCIRITKRGEDDKMKFEEIVNYLNIQNKGLNLKEVVYYDHKVSDDSKHVLIWFGVNSQGLSEIKNRQGIVYFDIEKTKITWPEYYEEIKNDQTQKKRKVELIG